MIRIGHTALGVLASTGTIRITATITAYAANNGIPLFFSLVDTQEKVRAMRAFIYAGSTFQIIRENMGPLLISCDKQHFETVVQRHIDLTGHTHMIIANKVMRNSIDEDGGLYVPVANNKNPAPEIFERIKKVVGVPLFDEWYQQVWTMAATLKLIMPIDICHGITIYRAQIDEKLPDLITGMQQNHVIPTINEIHQMRFGGQ